MSDLPGEAVTAGLQAMRKHSREAEDHDDFISECCVAAAFAAAAPHIDAAARASERENIRQLAIKHMARCEVECDWPECPDGTHYRTHWRPFADLIGGRP